MTIGIYALIFEDKIYVGQSTDINKRFAQHKYLLKANKHSDKLLQAYNTYGFPILNVLCICSKLDLDMYEDIYIKYYDSYIKGLNSLEYSNELPKPDNRGIKHGLSKYSEEQIIEVLALLTVEPTIKYIEICKISGVGFQTIANIASLTEHKWLKEEFPEEYTALERLKGTRSTGKEINTAAMQGKSYPAVISPQGVVYSNITNVAKFKREHNITSSQFYDLLNRKINKLMGWTLA